MRARAAAPIVLVVLGFFELASARTAAATPNFPAAIQRDLSAMATPPCTICHDNPGGGLGTVTTIFGMYMRSRGLVPYDEASLAHALDAARGEMHDSDEDGTDDVDALTLGLDPNGAGGGRPAPGYGCVGQIAGRSGDAGGAGASLLFLASVAAARWRRRQRTLDG